MGQLTVLASRVVLGLVLAGSVFVQAVMLPLLAVDLEGLDARAAVLVIVLLVIGCAQVVIVCVWRLLTMVRRGTVFSHAAFRFVDIVVGAVAVASALVMALGAVLAPGEEVAPGVVLLIGGVGLTVAGIGLIVLVLRMLLAQAVALDAEAHHLQTELDAVI